MARKIKVVQNQDEGRDKGKTFVITEMAASKAEKWAARAILALSKSGVDFPEGATMADLANVGVKALGNINYHEAESLMDEMMYCVAIQRDPRGNPNQVSPLIEEDIEEVKTRFTLKMEVFALHTGFSLPGANSTSTLASPDQHFLSTPMSRAPSVQ